MPIYLPIAEMSQSLPMLLALGFSIGVISGLFGVGGGFIMTPMLIFLGIPAGIAVGSGAAQVAASSVASAIGHYERRNVDVLLGLYLVVGGVIGAAAGIELQQILKARGQLDFFTNLTYVLMLGIIGMLMLIESVNVIRRSGAASQPSMRRAGQHSLIQRMPFKRRFRVSKLYISAVPPVIMGIVVGVLTAIMGVGGGFVLIPALIYLLRVPTRIALGTSAFQIIFVTVFATLLQSVRNHSVDVMLAMPLIVGGVLGAQLGVQLSERMRAEQLRAALAHDHPAGPAATGFVYGRQTPAWRPARFHPAADSGWPESRPRRWSGVCQQVFVRVAEPSPPRWRALQDRAPCISPGTGADGCRCNAGGVCGVGPHRRSWGTVGRARLF